MILYGVLVAMALGATAMAGKDRGPAFASGLAILLGWVLFTATWTEYAPDLLLIRVGIEIDYITIWCVADMIAGAAILYFGHTRWWSFAIYGLLLVQVALHCFMKYYGLEFSVYSKALDTLFLGQLAILMMTGGGKIADILLNLYDHAWHVFRSPETASRQEAQR